MALTTIDTYGLKDGAVQIDDIGTLAGNLTINDSGKLRIGTGLDLQLYHTGSHSIINNNTGSLLVNADNITFQSGDAGETIARFLDEGTCELWFNNSKKLETTADGIEVTGKIFSSSHIDLADSVKLLIGTGDDLEIYHDGSNSYITEASGSTPGDLLIQANNIKLRNWDGGQTYLHGTSSGSVDLYHDGNKKFETGSHGISVTGYISCSGSSYGYTGGDNVKLSLGNSNDLQIYHDGSHSYINEAGTGQLIIASNGTGIWFQKDVSSSENLAIFRTDGACELNFNAVKKLETTSSGVTISTSALISGANGTGYSLTIEPGTAATPYGLWVKEPSSAGNGYPLLNITDGSGAGIFRVDSGTGNITIPSDSKKLKFGVGGDLEIYHNGSHSRIDHVGTGNLYINVTSSETAISCIANGPIQLWYDNSKKFETTSYGSLVTGRLTTTGNITAPDSAQIQLGDSVDLAIYHDGSNSWISNATGNLYIKGSDIRFLGTNNDNIIKGLHDGAVELYHDGTLVFNTMSNGIKVKGPEGGNANLALYADEGDDDADKWMVQALNTSQFAISNAASGNWEKNLQAEGNAGVKLYYDNNKRFETISSGAEVTCNAATGTLNVLNSYSGGDCRVLIRAGQDGDAYLALQSDNSDNQNDRWKVNVVDGGNFSIEYDDGAWEKSIHCNRNSSVQLYNDNNLKLQTTPTGIDVTGGIRLGGNNAANECDDYEEGTWTPAAVSFSGGTVSVNSATYTKIGRLVHVQAYISFSNTSDGSDVKLSNLPFTASGSNNHYSLITTHTNDDHNNLHLRTQGGTTEMRAVYLNGSNGDSKPSYTSIKSKFLIFGGTYNA